MVLNVDFAPTILDIAGIPLPTGRTIDGVSMLPAFEGKPLDRPVPLFWRTHVSQAGDRVAVYASNRAEYLDLFWAAPKIGAVLQNLNWRLTVHELKGIVRSGAPKVLLFSQFVQGEGLPGAGDESGFGAGQGEFLIKFFAVPVGVIPFGV